MSRRYLAQYCVLGLALFGRDVAAEGTYQVGQHLHFYDSTAFEVHVEAGDVINVAVGNYTGDINFAVRITVRDPNGATVLSQLPIRWGQPGWITASGLPSGTTLPAVIINPLTLTASQSGTYTILFINDDPSAPAHPDTNSTWGRLVSPLDITVTDGAAPVVPSTPAGRLASKKWRFFQDASRTANLRFFAIDTSVGTLGNVFEISSGGTQGNAAFSVQANRLGLQTPWEGRSGPPLGSCVETGLQEFVGELCGRTAEPAGTAENTLAVFVNPPTVGLPTADPATPTLENAQYTTAHDRCTAVLTDNPIGSFKIGHKQAGRYRIVVDVAGSSGGPNGVFDPDEGDVLLQGHLTSVNSTSGIALRSWDGRDPLTNLPYPLGDYQVRTELFGSEVHALFGGVEHTSGIRVRVVDPQSTTPRDTSQFWSLDQVVGGTSDIQSSTYPVGLKSGVTLAKQCAYEPNAAPNSLCWDGVPSSAGVRHVDNGIIDVSAVFVPSPENAVVSTVSLLMSTADTDGDCVSNQLECNNAAPVSDPTNVDTDGDGLPDGLEALGLDMRAGCAAIPGHSVTNAALADTDRDGIPDGAEDRNRNGLVDPDETDPTQQDTDGDGISDGAEDQNKNGIRDPGELNPRSMDSDGDTLPDGVEDLNKNGKHDKFELNGLIEDTDGDGLDDAVEDRNANGRVDFGETDGANRDTDGGGEVDGSEVLITGHDPLDPNDDFVDGDFDGVPDFVEDANGNNVFDEGETDPTNADTDGDGIGDGVEDVNKNGVVDGSESDPRLVDTDGDGLSDPVEDANRNGLRDESETDPSRSDTDGDELSDGAEDINKNRVVDPGETDPLNPDSDGDLLRDGVEVRWGANPLVTDSDGDSLADGAEDKNDNGRLDAGETSPVNADTDGGGVDDGTELLGGTDPRDPSDDMRDSDADGIPDDVEDANGNGAVDPGETDFRRADSDGDGISDGVEDANKNGKRDENELDPLNSDTDGDGLSDGEEDVNRNGRVDPTETDPKAADTDMGGDTDGVERLLGTDPLDRSDDGTRSDEGCTVGSPISITLPWCVLLCLVAIRRSAWSHKTRHQGGKR